MSHAPTADHGAEAPNKLMTGDSFLESLRNGRQVFPAAAALIGFLMHIIGAAMVARVGLAGKSSALPVGVITSALGVAAVLTFTLIARPPTAPAQLAPVPTEAVR
ncbi:hypothetical protein [Streptomyces violascens]|uniref:hypothetical protein n=1 Tax=Streptomyces violascens TaxID=67381 RepID=UPI0036A851BA